MEAISIGWTVEGIDDKTTEEEKFQSTMMRNYHLLIKDPGLHIN